jgi:hypothetical protein
MRNCETCGQPIDPERLEILPHTTTCPKHSTVERPIGFMIANASKGTALSLEIVPDNKEALRQAVRANRRCR